MSKYKLDGWATMGVADGRDVEMRVALGLALKRPVAFALWTQLGAAGQARVRRWLHTEYGMCIEERVQALPDPRD
jgi:hypothetical protein